MPSKLKKAIAVVKDQTSISLAMVKTSTSRAHNSSSSLEVAILKATSHDDSPINPHHVDDILRIVSSNRAYASVCARSLGRRVGRTRSWMVALKSLLVVLRLFQANDPHFPKEVVHAMKTGYKILNLHDVSFSGSAASRESAAFVRSFAAYLSARLLALAPAPGKAEETNPDVLLDRVPRLQRLLDKAIAMGPTRRPPSNRLVLAALHAVARESFGLHKDVSDGLALLLDGFFHLQHASCVSALDACVVASRQFERLRDFYDLCVSSGIGTPSEYPDVKDIPDELIETLREFLKDQSSFPAPASGRRLPLSLIGSCSSPKSGDDRHSDPGDEKLSPMGDFASSVLSDSDFRNYSSSDFLDHEEGAAMLQGTSARLENDDEESIEESDDDNHQTASGWELALLETTMQQPSTYSMNSSGGFGVDFMEADATSSLLSHPSSGQYNPFLQDAMHNPSPMGNEGVNVAKSDDDFFRTLAFDNGYAAATTTTTSEIQPTFWVDFNDNGKGGSVDMFASTSISVGSGAIDPFSSFDNANSTLPNVFGDASFHADSSDMNPAIVPNANVLFGIAPSDELATLNRGCENANVGLASLVSGFGFENVTNPSTAIVPANELVGRNTFSSAPTFKAAAPFKVASDPFGSISAVESGNYQVGRGPVIDQQNVHNQQEMWLQIQNKILAKHLT